jgi:hypothetical protein
MHYLSFVMLEWAQWGFHKKHAGTCYAELLFLNPVESVGHKVHSCASGLQNIDALFLMLKRARCGFHKKRVKTRYVKLVFLHLVGSASHVIYFSVSGA